MARIEMTRDFDWRVPGTKSQTVIALKAGWTGTVKRQCVDDVVAAGAGTEIKPEKASDSSEPSAPRD